MDREGFLARVAACLEGAAVPAEPEPYRRPTPPSREEMTRRLCTELEAAGGVAHRAGSPGEARERILEVLRAAGSRKVIRGDTPLLRRLGLDRELESAGLEVTVADLASADRERLRQAAFAADAGITSADFGVAETGTLALLAAPGQGRAVSLLPPLHIAVLDESDVVFELAALFERVTARSTMPSALTFVTGPSRTGDIEQTLTIGVHGPGELHVVVIENQRRRRAPVLRSKTRTSEPRMTRDATLRQLPGR